MTAAPRLFLSHAHADADLADAFVDLLQTGCDVAASDLTATAVEGTGLTPGRPFQDDLLRRLKRADLVVQLITPSFWASPYCLCEVGAQWAMQRPCVPLIVPPLTVADLQGALQGDEVLELDRARDLDLLRDRVRDELGLSAATPRWNVKRDAFLRKALPRLLEALPRPPHVPLEMHQAALADLEQSRGLLDEQDEQIRRLQARMAKVVASKTGPEAAAAAVPEEDDEAFRMLTGDVRKSLGSLNWVVRDALYTQMARKTPEDGWAPPSEYVDEARDAEERGLLEPGMGEYALRAAEDHPRLRPLVAAMRALEAWEPSEEFAEAFEADHGEPWDFRSRGWWEAVGAL